MPPVIQVIPSTALAMYDQLLLIRDVCVNNFGVQLLSALFFAISLFVSIALFVYWCSCAYRVLSAHDLELTDEEIEPMRWDRKLREQLWHLFHSSNLTSW